MNYQAIARDAGGTPITGANISIRITITDSIGGPVLYRETHSPATNMFGLFTLNVGNGTAVTGTFPSISWGTVKPWMEVEMDPLGGNNYTSMGSTQLLSVPYALYAGSAPSSTTGQQSSSVFSDSSLVVTSALTTFTLIPGLTKTLTVPANSKVLVSTFGGVQTSASTAAGYSVTDITLFIDGAAATLGGYQRVIAANNTGLASMIDYWSFNQSLALAPGSHTIEVRAVYVQGSTCYVGSNSNSVMHANLTVTVINE